MKTSFRNFSTFKFGNEPRKKPELKLRPTQKICCYTVLQKVGVQQLHSFATKVIQIKMNQKKFSCGKC